MPDSDSSNDLLRPYGLFLEGTALKTVQVSAWSIQLAATVKADFVDTRETSADRAAMPARQAAQTMAADDFVELGFPSVLGELMGNRLHRGAPVNSVAPKRAKGIAFRMRMTYICFGPL